MIFFVLDSDPLPRITTELLPYIDQQLHNCLQADRILSISDSGRTQTCHLRDRLCGGNRSMHGRCRSSIGSAVVSGQTGCEQLVSISVIGGVLMSDCLQGGFYT